MIDATFFDTPIDRSGTACEKWDGIARHAGRELLPMWVADMDFACPPAVSEALQKRVSHPIYGYTEQTESQVDALLSFLDRRHGLTLTAEQQYTLPCVITGLFAAVRALTKPGDRIILQPPVYGPFFQTIEDSGRQLAENPLLLDSNGYYTMDFEGLEDLCRQGAKLMILCNPHNPVGRCWRREELIRLWGILSRYGISLISDEIHWDFVYNKDAFTSMLALPEAQGDVPVAVLSSASKTFNLAGLLQAVLLTRHTGLMQAITTEAKNVGLTQGNLFALVATEAAYREGDAWLDGLMAYLTASRKIVSQEVAARLPKAILSPVEATYLAWLDLRPYGFSTEELMRRTYEQSVALTEGTFFGKAGEGFLRLNFACPHGQLREGLARLERAVKG